MNCPQKQVKKEVSFDYVVAAWLRAEWYKKWYDHTRSNGIERIVLYPNLSNPEENKKRKELLKIDRARMMEQIPADMKWHLIDFEEKDIKRTFLIDTTWCRDLTGNSCRLQDAAANLEEALESHRSDHIRTINKIKSTISDGGEINNEIIFIAPSLTSEFVVLEGNHRLVSIVAAKRGSAESQNCLIRDVILGISPQVKKSKVYQRRSSALAF